MEIPARTIRTDLESILRTGNHLNVDQTIAREEDMDASCNGGSYKICRKWMEEELLELLKRDARMLKSATEKSFQTERTRDARLIPLFRAFLQMLETLDPQDLLLSIGEQRHQIINYRTGSLICEI